ncbi:MAG: TIGR01777 family oxidoreductase [Spirochaetes bacterium]|nr:TIGR01777 family oxidoreductase [Spirochaetota bacterium]
MNIIISGGSGFVGSALSHRFISSENQVSVLERRSITGTGTNIIECDTTQPGKWQRELLKNDIIINLAGASIFTRWTKKSKDAIYNSRISTTENIVNTLLQNKNKKITLINASAVGYYGFHGDEPISENTDPGTDFLAQVARDWELEALKAQSENIRVIICRFGIVLGRKGGSLEQMMKYFNRYLGTRYGNGKQWFSWIHIEDLVSAIYFLAANSSLRNAFNCTAPNPVTNKELTKALSSALKKPVLLPFAPAFAIKLMLGEFGDTLLKGQRVIPERLLEAGFEFKYPFIEDALEDLIR